jgi:FkbM family methyltransferase
MTDTLDTDRTPATGHPRELRSRGLIFPLDKAVLPPRARKALKSESYEKNEADTILRLIKPGDVVMELGAGIGFMSTLIARRTRAARIHSYEANPALIPYIREVHAANGVQNARVTNAVLGPRAGKAALFVRRNFLSSSLCAEDGDEIIRRAEVQMLDANATISALKPSVLVCDIEGGEADLLPGLDMGRLRAAVVELHPQWIGKSGVRAVFAAMESAGLIYFPRWSNAKVTCFRKDW